MNTPYDPGFYFILVHLLADVVSVSLSLFFAAMSTLLY
jgi:hypothetical protein